MTEMTGLEWGLVTSRQLVEIGSGFVLREVAEDGTRKLTTAGGESVSFDADGDFVATTAIAPFYQWKKTGGDLYRYAAGESPQITHYWYKLCKITTAMTFDIEVVSDHNNPYRASYRLSVSPYSSSSSYSVSLFNLGQTVIGQANLAVALDADGYVYIQTNAIWDCALFVTLLYSQTSNFSITMDKLGYARFGTASGFTPVKLITQTGAFRWKDTDGITYSGTPKINTELAKPKFTGKIKTEKAMNKVIFYDEDDEVVNPVNAIAGLEIGDVVCIKYEGYDKLHTVELLEAGYMIVNYEHCDTRGKGSLMLEDKTNVSATVELLTKWFNAPVGLGQAWVNVTVSRALSTNYSNTTGRPIQVFVATYLSSGDSGFFMYAAINGGDLKARCGGVGSAGAFKGATMSFVVPEGATYKVTTSNSNAKIDSWAELR